MRSGGRRPSWSRMRQQATRIPVAEPPTGSKGDTVRAKLSCNECTYEPTCYIVSSTSMSDPPDLVPMILENIQDTIADMRDRLTAHEARMEARWEANEKRWETITSEMSSWRERFDREQVLRERNVRKHLEIFGLLIQRLEKMDQRVTQLENDP